MSHIERDFLEYCESLLEELGDLADAIDGYGSFDRNVLKALKAAAEDICVEANRLIVKAVDVDSGTRRRLTN